MAYGNLLTDAVQSSTTGAAPIFKDGSGVEAGKLIRAYVTYNSSGTILNGFNVSSVVINATGYHTINFTNPMPNVNYGFAGTTTSPGSAVAGFVLNGTYTGKLTTAVGVQVGYAYSTYAYYTFSEQYLVFFG